MKLPLWKFYFYCACYSIKNAKKVKNTKKMMIFSAFCLIIEIEKENTKMTTKMSDSDYILKLVDIYYKKPYLNDKDFLDAATKDMFSFLFKDNKKGKS